jgi:hypothetical protein
MKKRGEATCGLQKSFATWRGHSHQASQDTVIKLQPFVSCFVHLASSIIHPAAFTVSLTRSRRAYETTSQGIPGDRSRAAFSQANELLSRAFRLEDLVA